MLGRSRHETSDAYHYRPQLNPEFARRARENNRKRKLEAEAQAREQERIRKLTEALEAIERAKEKRGTSAEVAPVAQADARLEPQKPAVVRTEFQRTLNRLLPVFGISYTELKSHRRNRELAFARQAICYWLCRRTEMSLPQIGRLLGGRDHTSILHARRTYPEKRAKMGRKLRPTR